LKTEEKKVAGISKIKKTDGTDGDVAMHGLSGARALDDLDEYFAKQVRREKKRN
jgi:hypothetical protein